MAKYKRPLIAMDSVDSENWLWGIRNRMQMWTEMSIQISRDRVLCGAEGW